MRLFIEAVYQLEPGARHELLMEQDRFRIQALAAFDAFIPGTPLSRQRTSPSEAVK
jgi:alpha-beta hydrolase superfamily lysophospholipase